MKLEKVNLVEELAESMKVGKATILKAVKVGKLKASKIGRRYYIIDSDVVDWIKSEG